MAVILIMDIEKWLMFSTMSDIYLQAPHCICVVVQSSNPCYSEHGLKTN